MSDPGTPNQPLLAAPNQQAANAQGGRSSRAYKVAGLSMLACVLIVSQVVIAYFLLSQRSDIKSLKEQNNNFESELTKGRSAAVPMQMHRPMNALPVLTDVGGDEVASTGDPEKTVPLQVCQLEAAGLKTVQVPGFRPDCDERGFYRVQQCFEQMCWCVNPVSGQQIPGSLNKGPAKCKAPVVSGSMSKLLTVPDVD